MQRSTNQRLGWVAATFVSALYGCASPAAEQRDEAELGAIELAVAEAPQGASCLTVGFTGSRSELHKIQLTRGQATSAVFDRLPAGLLNINARAFAEACTAVTTASVPTFVLASPVTVRVKPLVTARVLLRLIANGRVAVAVDFEEAAAEDDRPSRFAIVGDTPYGPSQVATFPLLIDALNDEEIAGVVHVGDIKNGSTRCDDAYFQGIVSEMSRLQVPLIYTPGDNEWTDCHRANNGGYDPLERLSAIRALFFATPSESLGEPMALLSQASVPEHQTFVENAMFVRSSTVFTTLHVVGSANGYAPWFGGSTSGAQVDDPARRVAEVEARIAAALDWIDRTFNLAEADDMKGAALFMQADTFQGSTTGFEEVIGRIAERAAALGKPVLLVQGDSHRYKVDQPLLSGSAAYGIVTPVPNLTRLVVEGETTSEWLRLDVDPSDPSLFRWERRELGAPGETDPVPTPSTGALVINEVSSNPNPDWIEFINPSASAVDLSGWYFTDNSPSDPTHVYAFAPGTTVAPGALLLLNQDVDFSFGLGSADSVVLHDATGAVVDQYVWTSHVTSHGRCPNGTGTFGALAPTPGSSNSCL